MSESQRKHNDTVGADYALARRNNPANRVFYEYWNKTMLELLPPRNGRFLDPMCGAGEFVEAVLDQFEEIYATDLSPVMISEIPEAVKSRAHISVADVTKLPFPDQQFDIVMIRGGLHHVYNQLQSALSEIRRVLKPDGFFICNEPIDDFFIIRWIRSWMYRTLPNFDKQEEHPFRTKELVNELTNAGFRVISTEPFGYLAYTLIGNTDVFPLFKNLRNLFIIKTLITIDRLMSKIPIIKKTGLTVNVKTVRC